MLNTHDPRQNLDTGPSKILINFACFETKCQNKVCERRKYAVCFEKGFKIVKTYEKVTPGVLLVKDAYELQFAHPERKKGFGNIP